jgi:anti-anti-sigma regulatory factor
MERTVTTTGLGEVSGLRVETAKDGHDLRVALHGESDFSTLSELDRALQRIELDGSRLVCLDLTHLAFADVATIRRLAAFAGHAKRAGPEVTTCGAHPTVRRVAGLLRVHGELGLSRPAPCQPAPSHRG